MDLLTDAISKLQDANSIDENQLLCAYVAGIKKFAITDEEKAFMLGNLFRHEPFSNHLPDDIKGQVVDAIKKDNLEAYFHGEMEPEFDDTKFFALIVLIIGIVAIVIGIIALINGYYNVGISVRYLVPIARGGGYWLIFGICFLIGGGLRYRYEIKKQKFLTHLLLKKNGR